MQLNKLHKMLTGLIIFSVSSLAFANPVAQSINSFDSLEGFQNDDDYNYSDDESPSSSHPKPTFVSPTLIPHFKDNNLTISTIVGKNATLTCEAENISDNNVILWYKNNSLLTTGKEVLSPEYALNRTTFALTVINASGDSQGNYFCEMLPQKIRQYTTLIVSAHPIEAIVPESSKSSQESVYLSSKQLLVTSTAIGILLFLRI